MSLRKCCGYRGLHSQMRQAEGLFQVSKGRGSVSMKAKAKSIFKPMKDALMLSKAQERMRRKHGDAIIKIGQKGRHVSLRVPGRLLKAYHAKMSACRYRTSSSSTFQKTRTKSTR